MRVPVPHLFPYLQPFSHLISPVAHSDQFGFDYYLLFKNDFYLILNNAFSRPNNYTKATTTGYKK